MIAVIDYDAGNVKSVEKAAVHLGYDAALTRSRKDLLNADSVILPGVGSFGDACARLDEYGLTPVIHEVAEAGIPFLGICLGLQLLFDSSEESPGVKGLGLIPGQIKRIPDVGLKVPHIGWNSLDYPSEGRLFSGIKEGSYVYFVHSYAATGCGEALLATTEYGAELTACAGKGLVFGCQFHPEKSGSVGLNMLKGFAET